MQKAKQMRTKVMPGGQMSISSFVSKNSVNQDSSSAKLSVAQTKLGQVEKPIKDEGLIAFTAHSPLKKSVLRDLENLLPSSPDLLSVPETPNSQIRLSPSRDHAKIIPKPKCDVAMWGKHAQLSPICRSTYSKGASFCRLKSENGGRNQSGSLKRLLIPFEEFHHAKRARTTNSAADSTLRITANSLRCNQIQPQEETEQVMKVSGFTLITEQKVLEGKVSGRLPTAGLHKPYEQMVKAAPQTEVKQKAGLNEREAAKTSSDGEKDKGRSLDQEQAGGMVAHEEQYLEHTCSILNLITPDMCCQHFMPPCQEAAGISALSVENGLDDIWFREEMVPFEGHLSKNKTGKVPDHVILCGGLNNRYWVLDTEDRPDCKMLTISCFKSLHPTETCLLKDGWETTPVGRGDVVHLEGHFDNGSWLVDREQGFLVLRPDYLVSGTSISSSIRCMRRAVLGDIFKSFDGGSKQMLNGTMVHEVFQKAAISKDFSLENLSKLADEAVCSPQHLGEMYRLGVSQDEMKQELYDYLPSMENWLKEYLSSPVPKGVHFKIQSNYAASNKGLEDVTATVTELEDIEENVWSPRFGLKGKIDLTARVKIQRPRNSNCKTLAVRTIPLELKTGRESNSVEHRSQVILYTLMTLERYNPVAGFLLYLKTGNLHPVVPSHMDRRELLKLRNTLVHYIHNCVEKEAEGSCLARLPDILTDRKTCQYCPQRRNCALYERALDSSSTEESVDGVRDFLQEETSHLSPQHLNYFSHWVLLCCLEASTMEAKNSRMRVWLQTAEEREKTGCCVGNLQLNRPVTIQSEGVFLHRFQRSNNMQGFIGCGLASGDRVVLSDQDGRFVGLATGYLCEVTTNVISCTLDRDLSRFNQMLFRMDGDEGMVGLSSHLTNLSRLMESCQNSNRLRELIVDLRPPEFIDNLSSVLPREAKETVANILKGLNKPQKQAMKRVLLSKDYTLIVGMPGTGKTTTICSLVRILHACGFSVLLTSYTHSAVDNILLKLKRFRVGFLRLGQGQKVHPEILPYTEENTQKKGVQTLSELEQFYSKELVVGTTCMGIKHPIFSRRQFDFCIVDEASQISQPICVGPLFYAKKFVLVGDHQQLPPIVQNQEARKLGMDESLFKRLELHSDAVVQLNVQYRMNRRIMSLSNCLMYEGRLECGSERTASALITLPFLPSVQSELDSLSETVPQKHQSWIEATLLPSNPVCFLDCSLVPALETVEQGGVSNPTEAALIHLLLSLLIKAGCKPGDIGVIAPYRQQLKSISARLQSPAFSGVEVKTVDKYQGRDKSLIVLSFVRSTAEEENLGELLKDWRRLNVAITRAKNKLVMVGSTTTLRQYAPVKKLLNHLKQENMIIQLPPSAHKAYPGMYLA